jgi:hypothetical protein
MHFHLEDNLDRVSIAKDLGMQVEVREQIDIYESEKERKDRLKEEISEIRAKVDPQIVELFGIKKEETNKSGSNEIKIIEPAESSRIYKKNSIEEILKSANIRVNVDEVIAPEVNFFYSGEHGGVGSIYYGFIEVSNNVDVRYRFDKHKVESDFYQG